jgi:hypothetical protein
MLARICACPSHRASWRASKPHRTILGLYVCPLNRTSRWLMAQLGTNRLGCHWARSRVFCRLTHSLLELHNLFGARPRVSRQGKWAQRGTNHERRRNSSIHHWIPAGTQLSAQNGTISRFCGFVQGSRGMMSTSESASESS